MNNLIKKWAKDLNRHFIKEDIQIENKHIKNAEHQVSLGNCKLKQWDTNTNLFK